MTDQLPNSLPEQMPNVPPPPPLTGTVLPTDEIYDTPAERRGCSGCMWGIAGALGCLGILILPILALILAGTISINSVVSNVRDIFNKPITVTAQIVLERVQGMSNLTVVRYNYSSLVTSEREMPGILAALYGEKQVMVAVGQVYGGIDLSKITADQVTVDGNTIIIKLPAPVLQACFLNEQDSYVVSRDTGIFANNAPTLDTDARRYAIHQFRDNALEGGILTEVQGNAQQVVADLIRATGDPDTEVQILPTQPDPNAALPDSCI
jgi:hypothetical protein